MDYLISKTDRRVVPYSEDAEKSGAGEWLRIDEQTAARIMNDPSGKERAKYFRGRAVAEARRLYEQAAADAAEAGVPAEELAPPAAPDAADAAAAIQEQMKRSYDAYAAGKSAPLTDQEKAQGIGDAGETAVAPAATPEQIAALPAPGEAEDVPAEPAPDAPAPAPATPVADLASLKTAKLRELVAAGRIKAPEGVDPAKASKEQILAANEG